MPASLSDLATGDIFLVYNGGTYMPVACGMHTKQQEHPSATCPACQNPQASAISGHGPEHLPNVVFATADGKTGYRPTCDGCVTAAQATIDYANNLEVVNA